MTANLHDISVLILSIALSVCGIIFTIGIFSHEIVEIIRAIRGYDE